MSKFVPLIPRDIYLNVVRDGHTNEADSRQVVGTWFRAISTLPVAQQIELVKLALRHTARLRDLTRHPAFTAWLKRNATIVIAYGKKSL